MYPLFQWRGKYYSILQCVDFLHEEITGSREDFFVEEKIDLVAFLKTRISYWRQPSTPYEAALLKLIEAVIAEWDAHNAEVA